MRSAAECSSQSPTGRNIVPTVPPEFTGGRKQKVNGKGGLLWTVRSEKSLDLSGFASPQSGQVVSRLARPGKRASNRPQNTICQTPFIFISRQRRSALPGFPISFLKPPHSHPCPTKQRYCMPLSCAGQTYPEKTGGRTNTGAFTSSIPFTR